MLFEKRSITVMPESMFRSVLNASTPTGLTITPENAMGVNAWFAAIRFQSFMVGSLPKILYQKQGDDRRRAVEHRLYSLLHDAPNEEMTAFDFWALMMSHVMARGNGFAEIVFDSRGQVEQLYPLNPVKVELVRNEKMELRYLVTLPLAFNNEKRVLRPEQVLHLRGLSSDGLWGYSVVSLLRNSIALAKATEEYGAAYFGNNAEAGVVLKHPNRLDDEVAKRIKESWEQAHMGLEKAHRAAILEEGMSVEKIGFNPQDSQFLETRTFQIYEIARATSVPPHLLFELSRATYSNIEHQSLEYATYHLRPYLVNFEQQLKRSLLLEREKQGGYFIEFLVDGIVRGDMSTRYGAYSVGLSNGFFSINDVLRKENMNSIPGGDRHYVPLNMAPLDENGMPIMPANWTPNPNKEPNTPKNDTEQKGIAFKPLFLDAADRIIRREINELKSARERYAEKGRAEKFSQWADRFYRQDYPEFIQTVLNPIAEAGIIRDAQMQDFIESYCGRRAAQIQGGDFAPSEADQIAIQLAGVY